MGAEVGALEKRLLTEIQTLRAIIDELIILRSDNAKNVTPLRSVVHGN
jgi:hypothetical protein